MDHEWAVERLREFVGDINRLCALRKNDLYDAARGTADELMFLDPVMRDLMNAAKPGFGDYVSVEDTHFSYREGPS